MIMEFGAMAQGFGSLICEDPSYGATAAGCGVALAEAPTSVADAESGFPLCPECLQRHNPFETEAEQRRTLLSTLARRPIPFHVREFTARRFGPPVPGMWVAFSVGLSARGLSAIDVAIRPVACPPWLPCPLPATATSPTDEESDASAAGSHRRVHSWPMVTGASPSLTPLPCPAEPRGRDTRGRDTRGRDTGPDELNLDAKA
jgi:hypothetical protein